MSQIRDYVLNLQANVEQQINVVATAWSISVAPNDVMLAFDNGPYITRGEGQGAGGAFDNVRIKSSVAQSITFSIVSDIGAYIQDSRATVSIAAVSATFASPNTITPIADVSINAVTSKVLDAADTKRRELLIKNPSTNTASFRVGDAAVAAALGFEIEPGESVVITVNAAVYAYNLHATDAQSLSLTKIREI